MSSLKWIVVVDQRIARLVSLQKEPGGRWHAEERGTLESRWEDYHEHHRPDALGGRSAPAHEHLSPGFSETEGQEERSRFARDVVRWLEHDRKVLSDEQGLTLFAASGFVGALLAELEKLHRCPEVHELELTRLRPEELAEHPAVRRAVGIQEDGVTVRIRPRP
jgi:hypothetical protein